MVAYTTDSLPPPTGRQLCGYCSIWPLSKRIRDLHNPFTGKSVALSTPTAPLRIIRAIEWPGPKLYIGKTQCTLISTRHTWSILFFLPVFACQGSPLLSSLFLFIIIKLLTRLGSLFSPLFSHSFLKGAHRIFTCTFTN